MKERPREDDPTRKGRVTVDDAALAIARFRNGALATSEATRFAPGRRNGLTIEINGSGGSLAFNLEEMNQLQFYNARDPEERRGFRDILVTESSHPYVGNWRPSGHVTGYEHTFVHTLPISLGRWSPARALRRLLPTASPNSASSRRSPKARKKRCGCGCRSCRRFPLGSARAALSAELNSHVDSGGTNPPAPPRGRRLQEAACALA